MNKKILIGSLVAVVIIILVSFTGVVGYQTTKSSNIARASPLFAVRSSRAIDEESKGLICDYVGKGEEISISVPTFNSRNTQMQKVIDRISQMDGKEFNHFKNLIIDKLPRINAIKESDIADWIRKQPMTDFPIRTNWDLTTDLPILCYILDTLSNIAWLIIFGISDLAWMIFILLFYIITGTIFTYDCVPMPS